MKAQQIATGRIEGAEMTQGDRDELQAVRKIVGKFPLLSALDEWAKASQLTTGNACSPRRRGPRATENLNVCQWAGVEIISDPYTYALNNRTLLTGTAFLDVVTPAPQAFARCVDVVMT